MKDFLEQFLEPFRLVIFGFGVAITLFIGATIMATLVCLLLEILGDPHSFNLVLGICFASFIVLFIFGTIAEWALDL